MNERTVMLYELSHSQADHEQQISAELATRGGLLAALVAVIAVGLTEFWHFHGRSWWLEAACALLIVGAGILSVASVGMDYARTAGAYEWEKWATGEDEGSTETETNELMTRCLYERYSECIRLGMAANDSKMSRLNWASGFVLAGLFCLLLGLLFS